PISSSARRMGFGGGIWIERNLLGSMTPAHCRAQVRRHLPTPYHLLLRANRHPARGSMAKLECPRSTLHRCVNVCSPTRSLKDLRPALGCSRRPKIISEDAVTQRDRVC